jgi:hypothetical protein
MVIRRVFVVAVVARVVGVAMVVWVVLMISGRAAC